MSEGYWARFADLPARVEHVIDWDSISTGEEDANNWMPGMVYDAVVVDIPSDADNLSSAQPRLDRIKMCISALLCYMLRMSILIAKFTKGA